MSSYAVLGDCWDGLIVGKYNHPGGERVSSIEVEGLIAEVPGVQECAVIGVRDEK